MIAYPGLLLAWTTYFTRTPSPGQQPTDIQVVSYPAGGAVPVGCAVNLVSGQVVVATTAPILGVAIYDPQRHSTACVYQPGDMVPVLRKGACFVQYLALNDPQALQPATFIAGTGVFTTDVGHVALPRAVYITATPDYFLSSTGSPWMDIPNPIPPLPADAKVTTFGNGTALVEINP